MIYAAMIQSQLGKDAPYSWYLFDCAKHHSRYDGDSFREQARATEAYLDACTVAAAHGEDLVAWFDRDDWGSLFVLLVVAMRRDDQALLAQAFGQIRADSPADVEEIKDAFLWQPYPRFDHYWAALFQQDNDVAKQAAMAISRSQGQALPARLMEAVEQMTHPGLLGEYCQRLGERRRSDKLPYVQSLYQHPDTGLRFAAAKAGKRLGDSQVDPLLQQHLLSETAYTLEALELFFINAPVDRLHHWLRNLRDREKAGVSPRVRCYAIAVAGLAEWVDELFPLMVEPEYARVAGEAFTLLTGIGIEEDGLDAKVSGCQDCQQPQGDSAAEPAEPADDLTLTLSERRQTDPFISDWEDDLPYPCPDATQQWWERHKGNFSAGQRYLAGKTLTVENLQQVYQTGNQRQRYLAALYLSINHQKSWRDPRWPPLR